MTKRSSPDQASTPSGPPSKHPRQERPSHLHPPLSSERLQQLIQVLRIYTRPGGKISSDEIYDLVKLAYRGGGDLPTNLVDENVFKTRYLREKQQLFKVLKKAIDLKATEDDQQALLAHSA